MNVAMTINHKKPEFWELAKEFLSKEDAVLAKIINQYHGEILVSKGDAFVTLARSIAGQQISVKAADAIWNRLEVLAKDVTAENILSINDEEFRSAGFSAQKINYMRNISHYFIEKKSFIDTWQNEDGDVIINALTSIKGVGKWTAEMFLIFYLLKPNVLPMDDIGLLKAIAIHYMGARPYKDISKAEYKEITDKWQPYCTVATWYLWRSLDPHPVEY